MTIEDRYRFIVETDDDGLSAFSNAEESLKRLEDLANDNNKAFDKLGDQGATAFDRIAAEILDAERQSADFSDAIDDSSDAFRAMELAGNDALSTLDRKSSGALGKIGLFAAKLTPIGRALSVVGGIALDAIGNVVTDAFDDAADSAVRTQSAFNDFGSSTSSLFTNLSNEISEGLAPSFTALSQTAAPVFSELAREILKIDENTGDLSDQIDKYARKAVIGLGAAADAFRLVATEQGRAPGVNRVDATVSGLIADAADFVGLDSFADAAEDRVARLDAAAVDLRASFGSIEDSLRARFAEIDASPLDTVTDETTELETKLGTLGDTSDRAAQKITQVFESAADRIDSLQIDNLGELDLSGTQLARRGLADLEDAELARIFGLELPEAKKQALAFQLQEQIGTLNVHLDMAAEIAIDEAEASNDAFEIAQIYQAQLDRNPLEVKLATDDLEVGLEGADQAVKDANFLTEALRNSGDAIGKFGQIASAEGSAAFESYQKVQVAFSTAAAISAALQSAAAAAASGNPFAAVATYASVGAALFSGVAQLKALSVGSSTPASLPAAAGTAITGGSSGPQGGTEEANPQGGGDTFNFTFIGKETDTITVGELREQMLDAVGNDSRFNFQYRQQLGLA